MKEVRIPFPHYLLPTARTATYLPTVIGEEGLSPSSRAIKKGVRSGVISAKDRFQVRPSHRNADAKMFHQGPGTIFLCKSRCYLLLRNTNRGNHSRESYWLSIYHSQSVSQSISKSQPVYHRIII